MKRTVLFSAVVLLASMGASGQSCGMGMGVVADTGDGGDGGDLPDGGGIADAGGVPDAAGGKPDGGGMGGGSGKIPHLINTDTGEDLGILIDLTTLTVFIEKSNIMVQLGQVAPPITAAALQYSEPDCMGKPLIIGTAFPPTITNLFYIPAHTNTYLRPVGPYLPGSVIKSVRYSKNPVIDGVTVCENRATSLRNDLTDFVDSGVKLRPTNDKLKVELR